MEMLNVGDDHGMRWLNQPIRNNANIDLAEIVFFSSRHDSVYITQ